MQALKRAWTLSEEEIQRVAKLIEGAMRHRSVDDLPKLRLPV
jgi:hypothetical protein